MKVINQYGVEIDFLSAVERMDDEIREEIHAGLTPCTEQQFFDAYCKRHAECYGENDFQPAQANPIW